MRIGIAGGDREDVQTDRGVNGERGGGIIIIRGGDRDGATRSHVHTLMGRESIVELVVVYRSCIH